MDKFAVDIVDLKPYKLEVLKRVNDNFKLNIPPDSLMNGIKVFSLSELTYSDFSDNWAKIKDGEFIIVQTTLSISMVCKKSQTEMTVYRDRFMSQHKCQYFTDTADYYDYTYHCEDGPAYIELDGYVEFYLKGQAVSAIEMLPRLSSEWQDKILWEIDKY